MVFIIYLLIILATIGIVALLYAQLGYICGDGSFTWWHTYREGFTFILGIVCGVLAVSGLMSVVEANPFDIHIGIGK